MRRAFALALATIAAAWAGTAAAADIGLRGAEPPPVVQVEQGGWYIRGDIGLGSTHARRWRYNPDPPWGIAGGHYSHAVSSAVFIGAGIGYAFNSWLRADLTVEYRAGMRFTGHDDLAAIPPDGGFRPGDPTGYQNTLTSNMTSIVTLANAYIDLGTWYGITPFIGAGIGFAHNRLAATYDTGVVLIQDYPSAASSGTIHGGSRTSFAWALMAGLAWDVSATTKVEIGYRYLNIGSFRSGRPCGSCGGAIDNYELREVSSHDVRIGLRYQLGAPAAPAAPIVARY